VQHKDIFDSEDRCVRTFIFETESDRERFVNGMSFIKQLYGLEGCHAVVTDLPIEGTKK
jgi:hypothetical protein